MKNMTVKQQLQSDMKYIRSSLAVIQSQIRENEWEMVAANFNDISAVAVGMMELALEEATK